MIGGDHDNGEAAFADGRPVPTESGRDSEEFLNQCCARHGVSMATLLEIISDYESNYPTHRTGGQSDGFKSKFGICAMLDFIINHSGNEWAGLRLFAYAINDQSVDDILGHRCPADWARMTGKSRYTFTKTLEGIQERFGFQRRPEQKTADAREKMRARRKAQLQ